MAFVEIEYKGKPLTIHKAVTHPRFDEKTVLVTDTWDYVDLWLRRSRQGDARFYWQQAKSFYEATSSLPTVAAPLTAYYCFLNAVKALLIAKNSTFGDQHGVSGFSRPGRTALSNEKIKFKSGGILAALCVHLGESANGQVYSLNEILYNLPYIHRAYDLTFSSATELFIPLSNPRIVRSSTTHEAWFVAAIVGRYANKQVLGKLPSAFEQEQGAGLGEFLIRLGSRFDWRPQQKPASIARYTTYHQNLRRHVYYIAGPQRLWYLKRAGNIPSIIQRSSMTLTFAAMHRLSELSRYAPDRLARHFEGRHNWLLSEFIASAPGQFIDEISSEMTGREFMMPGRASRR